MNEEQLDDVVNATKRAVEEAMRLTSACDHRGLQNVYARLVEVVDQLELIESEIRTKNAVEDQPLPPRRPRPLDYGLATHMARVLLDRHVWLDDFDWRSRVSGLLPPGYFPRRYMQATGKEFTTPGFVSFENRSISKTVARLEKRGDIERQWLEEKSLPDANSKVRLTDKGQKAKAEILRRAEEAEPGSLLQLLLLQSRRR